MAIRAVGQNIEVRWSHSGRNEKSNTISETTAVILQNVPRQFSSAFLCNSINSRRSCSCDMWLECEFWWSDEVAKENVLICDIAAAVRWHETMSLSSLNPARTPSTPLLHLCTLFLQMRRLGGYLSSNVSIWAGFSQSHSEGMNACLRGMRTEWSETERRLLLKGH